MNAYFRAWCLMALLVMSCVSAFVIASEDAPENSGDSGSDGSYTEDDNEDDSEDQIESWIYVSVPDSGTYSLREVLEVGTPGWDALVGHGEPIEAYEPITLMTINPNRNNNGIVVLMLVEHCLGDFTNDGVVNGEDVIPFVELFLGSDPAADLNSDGLVDVYDQLLFFMLGTMGCVVMS